METPALIQTGGASASAAAERIWAILGGHYLQY
jgi:hypothetical protein